MDAACLEGSKCLSMGWSRAGETAAAAKAAVIEGFRLRVVQLPGRGDHRRERLLVAYTLPSLGAAGRPTREFDARPPRVKPYAYNAVRPDSRGTVRESQWWKPTRMQIPAAARSDCCLQTLYSDFERDVSGIHRLPPSAPGTCGHVKAVVYTAWSNCDNIIQEYTTSMGGLSRDGKDNGCR